MKVSLSTPEKVAFAGESDDVLLKADRGQINVLSMHANLISFVHPGPLSIKTNKGDIHFTVGEGVLKVEGESVSILCQTVTAA